MARMDRESDSPSTEFKVAIAGPLVTLAIVVVLTAVGLAAVGCGGVPRARRWSRAAPASPACWR